MSTRRKTFIFLLFSNVSLRGQPYYLVIPVNFFFPHLQFLNTSSSHENLNLDTPALTSTPVCGHKMAVTSPFHRDQAFKAQKENHV